MFYRFLRLSILSGLLLFLISQSHASHTSTMELTYRHISNQDYEFTLIFYRSCNGSTATAPTTMTLSAASNSLTINLTNAVTLSRLPLIGTLNSPEMYNCLDTGLCYEEYIYRGIINLYNIVPAPFADDWIFSYSLCCSPFFTNVSSNTVFISCQLNNLDFPNGNNSPFWHNPRPNFPTHLTDTIVNYPIKSICANRDVSIPLNTIDYDGDSISYEIIEMNANSTLTVTYNTPYSFANLMPFITPPGLSLDSSNGMLRLMVGIDPSSTLDPNRHQLSIQAKEYRKDTNGIYKLSGYVERTMLIIVESTSKCPDDSIRFRSNPLTVRCDNVIRIQTNNTFNCMSADADGSFVSLIDSISGLPIYIDSVSFNCKNNSSSLFDIHLNNPLNPGTYYLLLKNGKDGNILTSECGTTFYGHQDTLWIYVNNNITRIKGSPDSLGKELSYIKEENCGVDSLVINFSNKVACNSIAADGSDFLITDLSGNDTVYVDSVIAVNCKNDHAIAALLYFKKELNKERYLLRLRNGTDGNIILDDCSEIISTQPIQIIVTQPEVDLGPNRDFCKGQAYSFYVDGGKAVTYNWSTGESVRFVEITAKGKYWVESDFGKGCIASDTLYVTENKCVGIAEITTDQISIYPNPTSGNLNIDIPESEGQMVITITDLSGRKIYSKSHLTKSRQLDLSQIDPGVYFTKVIIDGLLVKSQVIIFE